jgi:hypothetical protein
MTFLDGGQIPDGVHGFVKWFNQNSFAAFYSTPLAATISAGLILGDLTIVSESFHLRASVKQPDLTPVRVEGALAALVNPDVVVYQQPAKKALVPDSRLKSAGLWVPGQRHQNDARIHALAYAVTNHHEPTIKAYWPERED